MSEIQFRAELGREVDEAYIALAGMFYKIKYIIISKFLFFS